MCRLDHGADALFVSRVEKRKDQTNRDRAHIQRDQLRNGAGHACFVQGTQDVALGVQAFGHFLAEASGRQEDGRFRGQDQVVHLVAHLAADFQDVAESLGRDQADAGTLAFQHRVGGNRGAMYETGDGRGGDAPVTLRHLQRREHRPGRIAPRRWDLCDPHGAIFQPAHDIRKCAADIHANFTVHARVYLPVAASCHADGGCHSARCRQDGAPSGII